MDVESLESGSVDLWEEFTAGLASITNNETDNKWHECCYLLSTNLTGYTRRDTTNFRRGIASACRHCSFLLDALTTYCDGRLSIDSIVGINVWELWYGSMAAYYWLSQSDKVYEFVCLEIFQLKGIYTNHFVFV
jgi:hypothetical protein